ncbi:hemoglobin [Chitinivorax tropicus]|uniref:Hemoglobin n=1 Tax=Chitinivorax tropicus TaxID=714531 RepID=A0A840MME4_9PROT|nr:group II truncated hemoglobin [Chitinivorax tropicus]MBB5018645.1 hemoglobin [Chitinivorax tropicus]
MAELTPYELLGGEAVVRQLVDRFYDHMETDPRVKPLRDMHPEDLTSSREKLFMFLSGWLGGPDLFIQKFGHPMLRARHMPFPVDEEARDQWILCMLQAMAEVPMDDALREHLEVSFWKTADFMRNR